MAQPETAIGRLKRFATESSALEAPITTFQKGDDQDDGGLEGYRQLLLETIGKIARLSPETVKGYNTLSAAGTKTNPRRENPRTDSPGRSRNFAM